ncbi:C-X-C chemokine receptor type 5 [Spea bombifrons]|uniref:C-X-C chemokine receptor type 5 n=1 Tax=Spea bombifrons TaxID=233779 RepID=UPI00234A8272|nr:C-X-C chemokine receptor type 5 [Spea bombifrons]
MELSLVNLASVEITDFEDLSLNGLFLNYSHDTSDSLGGFVCPGALENHPEATLKIFQKFIIPVVYSLVFLLGSLGNGLVLLILLRHNRTRSTTDNFLLHLAVADLLMLITFPFSVVESAYGWVFGNFMCKMVGVLSRLNFLCSSLLLGCISVDRYLAIIHAVYSFRARGVLAVHLPCVGVWILCFLFSVPSLFFLGTVNNENMTDCTYHQSHFPSNAWWQANRFLNHVVGFLCPLFVMGFCYANIVAVLYKSKRREKRRAVKVAIVITGVFFMCWTPYNVVVLLDTLDQSGLLKSCMLQDHLPIAILLTEILGSVHCCLNPILYAFVGVKFRNYALQVLQRTGCLSSLGKIHTPDRKSSIMDSEAGTVLSSF